MNLLELLIGKDTSFYNMNMVYTYLWVVLVAFVVCVIISQKLNVYSTRIKKDINTTFNTGNEVLMQVYDEVAATTEDTWGTEDEQ